jgi:hypothetical protein
MFAPMGLHVRMAETDREKSIRLQDFLKNQQMDLDTVLHLLENQNND